MDSSHRERVTGNNLLRGLAPGDIELLAPHLEPIDLDRRTVLERPQEPIAHVHFLHSGIASTVAFAGRNKPVEVGLFGREGMSGLSLVLGNDRSPHETFVQVAGAGERIASDAFRGAMDASLTLRPALLRYVQVVLVQTAHTALANAHARLEDRLCRWILMCCDRLDGDLLPLTHEFLSMMLGVRRAGVTTAIHLLEGRGLIRARRGCIEIVDRDGLKAGAADIYGVPEAEYRRLIGLSISGR